jgi:hypothetical protein
MVAKAVVMTCPSNAIMKDASAVTPSTQFFPPSRQVPASPLPALFRPRHAALYEQDEWEVAGDTVEIFLCGRILLQTRI